MKSLNFVIFSSTLAAASVAYSGGIDYQEPADSGAFTIGAELLYVTPRGSDFVYGLQYNVDANNNTVGKPVSINSDYQFAYHVDLGYLMSAYNTDVSLGYTHLRSDDHKNKSGLGGTGWRATLLVGQTAFLQGGAGVGVANAKSDYDYIDVDLLVGTQYTVQNRYHFHPYAGVRYADLDNTVRSTYTVNGALAGTAQIKNHFDGVGARVGLDTLVDLAGGFGLVVRAAGSAILGKIDIHGYVSNPGQVALGPQPAPVGGSLSLKNSDEHLITPEIDYRLGLQYSRSFSDRVTYDLELGWTAVNYFDILSIGASRGSSSVALTSDWGYQGPYLRLQANIA